MHLPQLPSPTPTPSLQIRELDFHILTQTIVRPSTTIITTITLGTIDPASTETIAPFPLPVTSHHHSGLSGGQIGAILGSVVGIVVLLLIIGFCYVGRRRLPISNNNEKEYRYKNKRHTHNSTTSSSSNNNTRTKGKEKGSRTNRRVYEYEYSEQDAAYYRTKSKRKSSSSSKKDNGAAVQEPAAAVVAERIPGGPRYPTYRAVPISNPRNPQIWRTG